MILPALITPSVSLADKNWFQTGGPARFFCEPVSCDELSEALRVARQYNWDVFMLGQGANVLISDDGIDGLVMRPQLTMLEIVEETATHAYVRTGAGVPFPALIDYCLKNNLTGLEEFSGIPGTVGGSVFINIHYFEFLLSDFLVAGTVIERATGAILQVGHSWFNFSYNYSMLHEQRHVLGDALFKVKKATALEAAYACGRQREIIRHRAQRYPMQRTCGSFFRNFYEAEVTHTSGGKKVIYVAYYLDKVGVKGDLVRGGAYVSPKHANMIVSTHDCSSADIVAVARAMQQRVYDNFGIVAQPECRLVGFKEYPLLDTRLRAASSHSPQHNQTPAQMLL